MQEQLSAVDRERVTAVKLHNYFRSSSLDPDMADEERIIACEMSMLTQTFIEILDGLKTEWENHPTDNNLVQALNRTFTEVQTQSADIVAQLAELDVQL